MTDLFEPMVAAPPALPEPERERWQPLRIGLVELFHYDSEEFWFRDGHLLLRGNNGTGKSKVLSLTLPFLLDAQLRSSRIEPDGDSGKKMYWNLLLGSYPRRIGYSWIEFGRRAADGGARYLTLGAGLSAVEGRPQVESWFFVLDDLGDGGTRIGQQLWLTNEQRVVLGRERLRDAIGARGQVFESGAAYRRAIDERLFHLGVPRYEALMDTLIQLRHPQLSKKPDEAGLSHALTEALPPLPQELLGDVAEALNQLEEDRRQLEEIRELASAIQRFDQRYQIYAGMLARRQARELRQAQTDFDNASQERNQAQAEKQAAQIAEERAKAEYEEDDRTLTAARTRLETLQSDPTMQDANRLEYAERDARKRRTEVDAAKETSAQAQQRLAREEISSRERGEQMENAERATAAARSECQGHAAVAGVAAFATNLLAVAGGEDLEGLTARDFDSGAALLHEAVSGRNQQLALLRRRHHQLEEASLVLAQRREHQRELQTELEEAAERRAEADRTAERAGQDLLESWITHCAALVQLLFDAEQPLAALGDWVADPRGDNPAQLALRLAQVGASRRQAARQLELETRRDALRQETSLLSAEQAGLLEGRDAAPPMPHTRAAETRHGLAGAPLWQLVDFHEQVDGGRRAGLEAALEVSGLLDAWVTPAGVVLSAGNGGAWNDSQWSLRPPVAGRSLGDWLCAAVPAGAPVAAGHVENLLAGIGGGADDQVEAWIAPDGRFRLGALEGSWTKAQAVYIGHAARTQARRRRLEEIRRLLAGIAAEELALAGKLERLEEDRRQAEAEWNGAPSDQGLRSAQSQASVRSREFQAARARLERAESLLRDAEHRQRTAREALQRDAADLRLPAEATALPAIEEALQRLGHACYGLAGAAREWRRALGELRLQQDREAETRKEAQARQTAFTEALREAREAEARYETLRAAVGLRVDQLRQQLSVARAAVSRGDETHKRSAERWRWAGEASAVARIRAENLEDLLARRTEARAFSVARLQQFATSSLLGSAVPTLELPDLRNAWTIDPALGLARRVEQALSHLQDDEASWTRVQKQIAEDLQELQRALAALGHQAQAGPTPWGFAVQIIFHNRPERPDQLAAKLADDIEQRSELLSASERVVLENHLQAEIASEVQRLLRAAERQVAEVNSELQRRPTSTGVRFRLQWLPLGETEGAPVGLEIARERLLKTSADLWSAEDRRAIGTMLQRRIVAERERADAAPERGGDGSLLEQLARALDYRRWHHFRVQRLQDGQWRKLSGPASSGERALGLTVPLFAAIASFYSQGSNPLAPRLMLLDEAFAGIDDAARAHCMGLIREFDLDFLITSEREWACYAELPGVAICQLQRSEGIDAVYVSRWTWDGRAKRREDDPNRRFPAPRAPA